MTERLLVLDCESTAGGQTPGCEPIQISWTISDDDDVRTFKMKPNSPVLPCSTVIHGLTQADVDKLAPIETVLPKVHEQFAKDITPETVVTAYNTSFDFELIHSAFETYLEKKFKPKNQFDVLRLARKLISIDATGNHRLDTVFYFLFPDKLSYLTEMRGKQHEADADVIVTEQVIGCLWELAEETVGKQLAVAGLADFTNAPMLLDNWPFGKHYGEPIVDVLKNDGQYVDWFMKQSWIDEKPDLVYTIQQRRKR